MAMTSKLVSAVVGASALAVALHFIFSAFYEDAVDVGQIWGILDAFMAFGVLVSVAVGYRLKRALRGSHDEGVSRAYVEDHVLLYVAAFLALWFFWNWFDFLTVADGVQSDLRLTFWGFIDPLYVLVAWTASRRLWG